MTVQCRIYTGRTQSFVNSPRQGIYAHLKELLKSDMPIFGICLGHQLLALANGFKTKSPVQLQRLFIESPPLPQQPANNDPLRNCMDKLRSAANSVSLYDFTEER